MLLIEPTPEWYSTHPDAQIGVLELSRVENQRPCVALEEQKLVLADTLRQRYGQLNRAEIIRLPVMDAYVRYYKRFDKTYHVLLQLESLVHKGKNFHQVSPLVDANFMAELETFALTAGHDAKKLSGKLWIDVAHEGDTFCQMGGAIKQIPKNDMIMRDEQGIRCTILYGQDDRSSIAPQTTHVLYVTYAPAGVPSDVIHFYWEKVLECVRLCSPQLIIEQQQILSSSTSRK